MEQKRKLTAMQRLAGMLEVPAPSIANVTHMELEGNSQVRIENSSGILLYDSSEIRIKTGKTITQFQGSNLEIRCLSAEVMEIYGCIAAIHFLI